MAKPSVGTCLVLVALGLWIAAVSVNWTGRMPRWALFAVAPIPVVIVAFASGVTKREQDSRDPLRPWRHYRAAKTIAIHADSSPDCRLVLGLTREWDLAGPELTLRFHGVSGLVVRQFGTLPLHFDYLICKDRGADVARRKRFRVSDRRQETIEFDCDSFDQADANAPEVDS